MSQFSQENQRQYYEAQMQKKVLYVPNLSIFLMKINEQILKLPHELMQQGENEPIGTKYVDIVKSVINGIDMAYANLSPTRERFGVLKEVEFAEYKESEEDKKLEDYPRALKKLEWIYRLLDKADMLNDHIIHMELPDQDEKEEEEIEEEVVEDGVNVPSLPTPKHQTPDSEVGDLDSENKGSLAKKDLA